MAGGALLFLLPLGGVLVPLLGWLVGVALLWGSDRWTTREKLVGTFVVPGGYLPLVWLMWGSVGPAETSGCTQEWDPVTGEAVGPRTCTGDDGSGLSAADVLWIALVVVLLVAPLVTVVFLRRRLRRRTA